MNYPSKLLAFDELLLPLRSEKWLIDNCLFKNLEVKDCGQ